MSIISWTFSEAQMGKDQLDVSFSYCGTSFKSYVSGGHDILTGFDMFKALMKHPVAGTSLVLTDVREPTILPTYDKCPLQIQKVHHFEYGPTEVVVRHHNEIETAGVWRTSNTAVQKWIETSGFKSKAPKVLDNFPLMKELRCHGSTKKSLGKRKRVPALPFPPSFLPPFI